MERDRFSITKVEAAAGDIGPIAENQVDNGVTLKGFNLLGRKFSKKNDDRKMSLAQLTK